MSQLVLLDNEAAQALGGSGHAKRRRVLAHLEVVARRKRRAAAVRVAVPAAVRVEAGWDRRDPRWALANRLVLHEVPLDRSTADDAAGLRSRHGVSVADAHLGAAIRAAAEEVVVVLTSDRRDVLRVAEERRVRVVPL